MCRTEIFMGSGHSLDARRAAGNFSSVVLLTARLSRSAYNDIFLDKSVLRRMTRDRAVNESLHTWPAK
jgi:hypothetical protein